MDVRTVIVVAHSLVNGEYPVVRQSFLFGDIRDHIFPETVHTHVKPKTQDLLHFFPHQGVIHVQIRLLYRKQMQVVFASYRVPGPGFALKIAVPVVGKLAVRLGGPPDVVIGVGVDPLAALLKPFMLIAGVVDHQIHDHFYIPLVGTVQYRFKCLHAAKFGGDVHIIGNVITAVGTGGGVNGGEPNTVATQGLDIVQLVQHAPQIAHTVPVSVLKTSGPDLIKYPVFIPFCVLHSPTSCLLSL